VTNITLLFQLLVTTRTMANYRNPILNKRKFTIFICYEIAQYSKTSLSRHIPSRS